MSTSSSLRALLNTFKHLNQSAKPRRKAVELERLENRVLLSLGTPVITQITNPAREGGQDIAMVVSCNGAQGPWVIKDGVNTPGTTYSTSANPFTFHLSYSEEGNYNVKATAVSQSFSPYQKLSHTGSLTLQVNDQPITVSDHSATFSLTENQTFTHVWSVHDDGDQTDSGGASDLTLGTVSWGHGAKVIGSKINGPYVTSTVVYTGTGKTGGSIQVRDDGGLTDTSPFTVVVTEPSTGQPPNQTAKAQQPNPNNPAAPPPPPGAATCPPKKNTDPTSQNSPPSNNPDPRVTVPVPGPTSNGLTDLGIDPFNPGLRPSMNFEQNPNGVSSGILMQENDGTNTIDNDYGFDGDHDSDETQTIPGYVPDMGELQLLNNGLLVRIRAGGQDLYFKVNGDTYTEYFYYGDTLTHDIINNDFILKTANGTEISFYDGMWGRLNGQIRAAYDRYGHSATFNYDSATGELNEIVETDNTGGVLTTQSFLYTWSSGQLQSITLRRKVNSGSYQTAESTDYTFYGSGDPNGNFGDLKTATMLDANGNVVETSYYRYWIGQTLNGVVQPADAIKYYLSGPSYARAAAGLPSGTTPLTATDAQLAPYADAYVEYDSTGRTSKYVEGGAGCSSCSGGLGTFLYSYAINLGDTGAYNSWHLKVTETLPDGTIDYLYYNQYGQQMLSVMSDGTHMWGTFSEYDSYGRPILLAEPSAVDLSAGLSTLQSYPDLLDKVGGNYTYLKDTTGLITTVSYYSGTTATSTTAGSADGYISDVYVQQGETGTPIHQEHKTYFAFTGTNGASVYPIAADTVYANTDGTDARTTSYAYTMYSGSVQPELVTITSPVISSSQNGSGVADTTSTFYNYYGLPIWTKDGDGHVNYTAYDVGSGGIIETITDVNYSSLTSDQQTSFNATGWSHPSGLNLVTTYVVDSYGRTTKETSPNGNVTYTVYNDVNHEVRAYPGFNSTNGTTTGPILITREYYPAANSADFFYTETITSSAMPHLTGGVPDGTETLSAANIQSLQRDFTNAAGQVIWSDKYASFSGITYSQAVAADGNGNPVDLGTSGTSFYRTVEGYDHMGRPERVVLPTGTIERTVYDSLGRVISKWVGTNDTPGSGYWSPTNNTSPSNMMDVEDLMYDSGGVGDSNLTQVTDHVDTSSSDDRVTQSLYDFRDRQVASKSGIQSSESDGTNRPLVYTVYDNLGEATRQYLYTADGVNLGDFSSTAITDGLPTADASDARALSVNSYDDQGRVYRSQMYNINQSTGISGLTDTQILALPNLATDTFYDHRGNAVAIFRPGARVTKSIYDGAGRLSNEYITDGGAVNNSGTQQKDWTHATSLSSDVVLQETDYTYDSDGNVILTLSRQRFDNDSTTSTGALGSPTSGIGARVYYLADYYDAADRLTDEVNVGTNGGTAWTRPSSVPSGSTTVLVTHTDYDVAGNAYKITDPRGVVTQLSFDMLGRKTQEIDGATGSPATGEGITNWTFDGDNNVLTMQAVFPGTSTPSQTTAYIYGIGGTIGTNLFSNDIIQKVEYPDKTTGNASTSASNDVSYTYNLQGEVVGMTDQNGTTHSYLYDVLGRLKADIVTTLGSGVDGSIRRLGYNYTQLGLPFQQTSYSDTGGTTVVNQVQDVYNAYGQLTNQYQAVSGSVNTSSTPQVQYTYSQPSGANYSRLTSMTYPNGRVLDYVYNSGIDTNISRVSGISDDAGTGAGNDQSYTYLGLDTIVQALDGNGIELTYIKQSGESNGDAGDQYIGLDRYGRVVDQRWIPTSSPTTPTDRFQYGYDQDGNVLYKNNLVNSSFSELYHANSSSSGDNNTAYDNLNRLQAFRRGTLSASSNNGGVLDTVSTLNTLADSSQSYTLDAVGNQTSVTTDGTAASRTVNSQNQVTAVGSTNLAYDNNGNTTTDDQGHTLVYDAWNRLVTVKNGSTTLGSYTYDANGSRMTQSNGSTTINLYVDSNGNIIEERNGSTVTDQNIWGLMYINQLVLRDDNSSGGSYGFTNSGLGRRLYVQQDANWNVTALVNTSGSVVERFIYTPYGIATVLTASWASSSDPYSWTYTFQGGRYDPNTGLIHFGAREYNPRLGTWVQQDPTNYTDGPDRYESFLDNPSTYVDSTGLKSTQTIFGAWYAAIVAEGMGGEFAGLWNNLVDQNGTDIGMDFSGKASWHPNGVIWIDSQWVSGFLSPQFALTNNARADIGMIAALAHELWHAFFNQIVRKSKCKALKDYFANASMHYGNGTGYAKSHALTPEDHMAVLDEAVGRTIEQWVQDELNRRYLASRGAKVLPRPRDPRMPGYLPNVDEKSGKFDNFPLSPENWKVVKYLLKYGCKCNVTPQKILQTPESQWGSL